MSCTIKLMPIACLALIACMPPAEGAPPAKSPRQPRPATWPAEATDAFFKDAREHLKGERPQPASAKRHDGTITPEGQQATKFAWSRLIDGETLATEIKRVAARLHDSVASPTRFKADGFKQCREGFGQLAILFAVIAEYDGDVRWREEAPTLRDALAKASRSCKKANDASFAEATARVADLDEIIRGGRLASAASTPIDNWNSLAARSILMLRMQTAWRDTISPELSDAPRFAKSAVELRHEAQLLAMCAEIIHLKEFDYWDDDAFVAYARQLQDAATALARAADQGNFEAARQASGRAGQACAACHDDYRG